MCDRSDFWSSQFTERLMKINLRIQCFRVFLVKKFFFAQSIKPLCPQKCNIMVWGKWRWNRERITFIFFVFFPPLSMSPLVSPFLLSEAPLPSRCLTFFFFFFSSLFFWIIFSFPLFSLSVFLPFCFRPSSIFFCEHNLMLFPFHI